MLAYILAKTAGSQFLEEVHLVDLAAGEATSVALTAPAING